MFVKLFQKYNIGNGKICIETSEKAAVAYHQQNQQQQQQPTDRQKEY